jgi:lysozyme
MNTSQEGIDLIKSFEGCELTAYKCSAGVWTIGYGHTRDVTESTTCTQDKAEVLLKSDLYEFERYVNNLVTVPLTQCQFDALVCFTYNLGPTNLKSSTLLRVLNSGDYEAVPAQLIRWDKVNGRPLAGLTRRRIAEVDLWNKGLPE